MTTNGMNPRQAAFSELLRELPEALVQAATPTLERHPPLDPPLIKGGQGGMRSPVPSAVQLRRNRPGQPSRKRLRAIGTSRTNRITEPATNIGDIAMTPAVNIHDLEARIEVSDRARSLREDAANQDRAAFIEEQNIPPSIPPLLRGGRGGCDRLQARAKTKAANQDVSQLPSDLIKPYELGILEAAIAQAYDVQPRDNPFNWFSQPTWWNEYESGIESARVAQIEAALVA